MISLTYSFSINRVQLFHPLLPSLSQKLVNVARSVPPPVRTSSNDLRPSNTFNLPLTNLLNDQLSLQFGCFRCHLVAGVVLAPV